MRVTRNTTKKRWVDRLAYRLTQAQFSELRGRPVERPGWGLARITLLSVAAVLLAAIVASASFGIFLVVYHFPSGTIVPGAILLMFAALLWPRFGRLDKYAEPVTPEDAPTLFRVIDEVAQALGTPGPHVVLVDESFNAWAGAVGLRRRRVIALGLPLLGVLAPQERVALIGHELGHFVNGDIRHGMLTQLPLTAFAHLADVLRPSRLSSARRSFLDLTARVVLVVPRFLALCAHVGMVWIGARSSQRAEYLADQMSARAAGSDAAVRLYDVLVSADVAMMITTREARKGLGPADWRVAVDETRAELGTRVGELRERSARADVSMFRSHPPAGLRAELVASRPYQAAAVVLTESDAERMDTELKRQYERTRRTLAAG